MIKVKIWICWTALSGCNYFWPLGETLFIALKHWTCRHCWLVWTFCSSFSIVLRTLWNASLDATDRPQVIHRVWLRPRMWEPTRRWIVGNRRRSAQESSAVDVHTTWCDTTRRHGWSRLVLAVVCAWVLAYWWSSFIVYTTHLSCCCKWACVEFLRSSHDCKMLCSTAASFR